HLSEEEMAALIGAAEGSTPLGRRDRAILELFYASGLRLSELAGLDVDDINVSAKMVRVLGKGGRERIVPFNSSTAKAIREYLGDRQALVGRAGRVGQAGRVPKAAEKKTRSAQRDPLFVNFRGGRLTVRSIDRLVRRYVAASSARMGI